jgi:hypothetical protein
LRLQTVLGNMLHGFGACVDAERLHA